MSTPSTTSVIDQRIKALERWIEDHAPYAPFDQRHLDGGTPEQAYWHLGYKAALQDVIARLKDGDEDTSDSANHCLVVDQDEQYSLAAGSDETADIPPRMPRRPSAATDT